MELDDNFKFALDCEVNSKFRRPDAIRSAILLLEANRNKSDYNVIRRRRSVLMGELSKEVDREDGTNSYITLAKHFAKDSPREVAQHKWTSLFAKRLEEGMSKEDIVTLLNPKLKPMVELANQKYMSFNKERLLKIDPDDADQTEDFSDLNCSGESIISEPNENSPPSTPYKPIEESPVEMSPPKPKKFMTGLEVHCLNKVAKNQLDPEQAKQICEETRKKAIAFNNPLKKPVKSNQENKENLLLNNEHLKGIDKSMIELIKSEIISNLEGIDWTKIAGLNAAKSKIREVAILPLLRPDLFTGIRTPPKGILLFGPPGTGKTMIGKCIASQANATFFSITSSTLTSKWVGNSEKTMKTLFAVARAMHPSVIFIDEIDSLLKSRSDSEHESERRMKTEFLSQFDGLSNHSNKGLLVIGTTNRPQELDDAVRRRFAARLYISMPEKAARKDMIQNNLIDENHTLTNEEMDDIAERTEGYSGSDIKDLCGEASMHPFKEVMDRLIHIEKKEIRPICHNDFLLAISTVKPSFSKEDLQQYTEWNTKYGSC